MKLDCSDVLIKYVYHSLFGNVMSVSNTHRADGCDLKIVYLSELSGISFTIFVGLDFFRGDGAMI